MSDASELRFLLVAGLVVLGVAAAWILAWAVREARDVDPTPLAALSACLETEHGLSVESPTGDVLADSAPGGSLRTAVEGNAVTVSIWARDGDAVDTLRTYERLTPENLEGRAIARGSRVSLWAAPPTEAQASILYGCEA